MQQDLTGRVALVTGAGHGIGAALALGLARAGADVAVHYANSAAPAEKVVAQIEELGRRAVAVQGDLMDSQTAASVVASTVEALGGLDILVNNAGNLVGRSTVAEMTDEHWAKVWGVNVSTAFFVTRAAVPHLTASDHGRVISLASLAAENGGGAGSVAYVAAKAGSSASPVVSRRSSPAMASPSTRWRPGSSVTRRSTTSSRPPRPRRTSSRASPSVARARSRTSPE
ncbi:hypothetical protein GCM10025865_12660 [Paraoerskovia sediminicola]|uniref:Short chain dehydrogenase n=1 Tax=Paraoerskovia sediminicola TaxID=1138587 RepID=A0ABN6XB13_9CELL|nr:hypothetical protein GCM10025865_12660 [Paraoerskovia sediminicola]